MNYFHEQHILYLYFCLTFDNKNLTDNKAMQHRITYAEGVNFEVIQPTDVQEIPPPTSQPSLEALPVKEHESQDEVIFDIEATGLGNCNLILLFQNRHS